MANAESDMVAMVAAVEHEISCPICLDDFEEPKCLPSCAHNVCQHCLEGMVKRKDKIECPVCRVESIIPQGGVAAFPKNHLLVRLIERTPGRKEKESMKQALKNCSGKLQGAKGALKEMGDRFAMAENKAEQVKLKIRSLAENIVAVVREQERRMFDEIDVKLGQTIIDETFEKHKSNMEKLCENASCCMQTVQDILQKGKQSDFKYLSEALVEELKDFSESLERRITWANWEFTAPFNVSLTGTESAEKFIEDEYSLGKLTINTGEPLTPQNVLSPSVKSVGKGSPVTSRVQEYSKSGTLIQSLDNSLSRVAQFTPFSVAVSRNSGDFVVLDVDKEMQHVLIFNEKGEPLKKFQIKSSDPWDLAVLNDIEIVVLNRESNHLQHYDMNGNERRTKKTFCVPNRNVKFSSLSVDIQGRFIISSCPCYNETNSETVPCVLVYNPLGKLTLSFGEDFLSSPEKAVFLNRKFFVADSGHKCVIVFNKNGDFLEQIESSQLEIPSSIAADYNNGHLVVSDSGNSTIQIYSQAGKLLNHFQTEHAPIGVAFTRNYKNLLICF